MLVTFVSPSLTLGAIATLFLAHVNINDALVLQTTRAYSRTAGLAARQTPSLPVMLRVCRTCNRPRSGLSLSLLKSTCGTAPLRQHVFLHPDQTGAAQSKGTLGSAPVEAQQLHFKRSHRKGGAHGCDRLWRVVCAGRYADERAAESCTFTGLRHSRTQEVDGNSTQGFG